VLDTEGHAAAAGSAVEKGALAWAQRLAPAQAEATFAALLRLASRGGRAGSAGGGGGGGGGAGLQVGRAASRLGLPFARFAQALRGSIGGFGGGFGGGGFGGGGAAVKGAAWLASDAAAALEATEAALPTLASGLKKSVAKAAAAASAAAAAASGGGGGRGKTPKGKKRGGASADAAKGGDQLGFGGAVDLLDALFSVVEAAPQRMEG